jgi:hypothetical protein
MVHDIARGEAAADAYSVSTAQRVYVEECEDPFGFEELQGWDVSYVRRVSGALRLEDMHTLNDFAEDTSCCHVCGDDVWMFEGAWGELFRVDEVSNAGLEVAESVVA